jgi:uncharacterized protein YeaO (DUF488 family)
MAVVAKRIYEPKADDDGYRVLVDRLWPRGLAKAAAEIDEWAKAVSPSTELRKWYGHEPAKFDEFQARYRAELAELAVATDDVERLRGLARRGRVTLLTATADLSLSHVAVLTDLLS